MVQGLWPNDLSQPIPYFNNLFIISKPVPLFLKSRETCFFRTKRLIKKEIVIYSIATVFSNTESVYYIGYTLWHRLFREDDKNFKNFLIDNLVNIA